MAHPPGDWCICTYLSELVLTLSPGLCCMDHSKHSTLPPRHQSILASANEVWIWPLGVGTGLCTYLQHAELGTEGLRWHVLCWIALPMCMQLICCGEKTSSFMYYSESLWASLSTGLAPAEYLDGC